MAKNKLRKFAEMEALPNVFQASFTELILDKKPFELRGKWSSYFGNDNPIVLELGCGRGEYAVSLARNCPNKNYIGIDIKGSRMHTGATQAHNEGLHNCAFVRTSIEAIAALFAPNEVSEIWITFADPQMKKATKRLTGTRFISLYQQIMAPNGVIHLKTDSPFLFTYTREMIVANGLPLLCAIEDIYAEESLDPVLKIQTYYESQWLKRGMTIKYLSFTIDAQNALVEPDVEIEYDSYRSYGRSKRSELFSGK